MNWEFHENPKRVVKHYSPVVYHQVKDDLKDSIQPIYFGKILKTDDKPVAYYELNEYLDYRTVVVCYFHRLDWTDSPFNIMQHLDSHHFDFEGWIKCIDNDGNVMWTATRFHNELLFVSGDVDSIEIEACGHGIKPLSKEFKIPSRCRIYEPDIFVYESMKYRYKLFSEKIYPIFRRFGVTEWRDWSDWRITRKFGLRSIDLIWKDPMKLYKYAKKCLIVKGD